LNDPRPEFGDGGYIDAKLGSFTAIVVAIAGFVLVPIDIVTQRETGALRRIRATRCVRSPTSPPTCRCASSSHR
jgi:ABC-2 type transport system permease protein